MSKLANRAKAIMGSMPFLMAAVTIAGTLLSMVAFPGRSGGDVFKTFIQLAAMSYFIVLILGLFGMLAWAVVGGIFGYTVNELRRTKNLPSTLIKLAIEGAFLAAVIWVIFAVNTSNTTCAMYSCFSVGD